MYLSVGQNGRLSRGRGFGAVPPGLRRLPIPRVFVGRRRPRRPLGVGALTADQLNGLAPIPITDPVYGTTQMLYRDPTSGTMLPLGESISPTGQYSCNTSDPASQCYNLPGSPAGWSGPSTPVPFIGGKGGFPSTTIRFRSTEPMIPPGPTGPMVPAPQAPQTAPPYTQVPQIVDTPQPSPIIPAGTVPAAGTFDISAPVNVAGLSLPLWGLLAAGGAALYFFGGRK